MTRPNVIIRCGQCHTTMRDPPPIVRCSMCGRGPAMTASKIQRYGHDGSEMNEYDDEYVRTADHLASITTLTAERDEAVRLGKQFEADARKHFDQSCLNLNRAESAESRVRELEGELSELKDRYKKVVADVIDLRESERWRVKRDEEARKAEENDE